MTLESANCKLTKYRIVRYRRRYAVAYHFTPPYDGARWQCTAKRGYGTGRTPEDAVLGTRFDGGRGPRQLYRTIRDAFEHASGHEADYHA